MSHHEKPEPLDQAAHQLLVPLSVLCLLASSTHAPIYRPYRTAWHICVWNRIRCTNAQCALNLHWCLHKHDNLDIVITFH